MGDPKLISFVARSRRRIEILKLLIKEEKSQPEIMKLTHMYKAHTSRTIKELVSKKLIICKNPEDREYKFYKITSLGRRILEKTKKIV